MRRFVACLVKDALLLWRDRTALLVLFLMPVALVVVIAMILARGMELAGDMSSRIVLVDDDGGELAGLLVEQLRPSGFADIVTELDGQPADEAGVKAAVARGRIQVGLVIPAGTMRSLRERARTTMTATLGMATAAAEPDTTAPTLVMYFDPAVQGFGRIITQSVLERIALDLELREKMAVLSELLPAKVDQSVHEAMGRSGPAGRGQYLAGAQMLPRDWARDTLAAVDERPVVASDQVEKPNSNQQTVPAWTLFGMFFIVVPLSGSLVLERTSGTLLRLYASPAPDLLLLTGKASVYLVVCMTQCALILGLGKLLLPRLGAGDLELSSAPWSLVAVALSASCAAIGFGVLIGAGARSFQQASVAGPLAIVTASALGGIMVPIFIMPRIMQRISLASPLGWGLRAFQDILVRGGDIRTAWPWMALLLAFAAVCALSGVVLLNRHRHFGGAAT